MAFKNIAEIPSFPNMNFEPSEVSQNTPNNIKSFDTNFHVKDIVENDMIIAYFSLKVSHVLNAIISEDLK